MLRRLNNTVWAFCLVSGFVLSGLASAQTTSSVSRVVFEEAVRLPGVLLPAGTYDFKGSASQNVVLVYGRDGRFIAAVPARGITRSAVGPTFMLQRSASDKSLEVVNWRADGKSGFEFLYPHATESVEAPVLAKTERPVIP